jgi:hypothetical protein
MPVAPRPNKKARKIVYSLLGVPANLAHKLTKREKYINSVLLPQETFRVR